MIIKPYHTLFLRYAENVVMINRLLSVRYHDIEALIKFGKFWKKILSRELLPKLIGLLYEVTRLFFMERMEKRFGEEFQQKMEYYEDVVWFFGQLRTDPTGKSLNLCKTKEAYLKLFRSPYESERMVGRLAGMMIAKWHIEEVIEVVDEIMDENISDQDCKEVVILLGAAAMCPREHEEQLKRSIDDWTELMADNFAEFWDVENIKDLDSAQSGPHRGYPFSQAGFLRLELGMSIHDIYLFPGKRILRGSDASFVYLT